MQCMLLLTFIWVMMNSNTKHKRYILHMIYIQDMFDDTYDDIYYI